MTNWLRQNRKKRAYADMWGFRFLRDYGRDVCYLITKLVPREKSPDPHRSQSQMKFTNRREKKGQKTKVLRKSKRNDILKSRMERISRKWSIISNVGER